MRRLGGEREAVVDARELDAALARIGDVPEQHHDAPLLLHRERVVQDQPLRGLAQREQLGVAEGVQQQQVPAPGDLFERARLVDVDHAHLVRGVEGREPHLPGHGARAVHQRDEAAVVGGHGVLQPLLPRKDPLEEVGRAQGVAGGHGHEGRAAPDARWLLLLREPRELGEGALARVGQHAVGGRQRRHDGDEPEAHGDPLEQHAQEDGPRAGVEEAAAQQVGEHLGAGVVAAAAREEEGGQSIAHRADVGERGAVRGGGVRLRADEQERKVGLGRADDGGRALERAAAGRGDPAAQLRGEVVAPHLFHGAREGGEEAGRLHAVHAVAVLGRQEHAEEALAVVGVVALGEELARELALRALLALPRGGVRLLEGQHDVGEAHSLSPVTARY